MAAEGAGVALTPEAEEAARDLAARVAEVAEATLAFGAAEPASFLAALERLAEPEEP